VAKLYKIKKRMIINFRDVVKGDEFLSLSIEEVIKLISSDVLNVPSEEKVSKPVMCNLGFKCSSGNTLNYGEKKYMKY